MDDDPSIWPNLHDGFGFPPSDGHLVNRLSSSCDFADEQCHPFSSQDWLGPANFPPPHTHQIPDPVPFPSQDWLAPANSAGMPFPYPNPLHLHPPPHLPTWWPIPQANSIHEYADHASLHSDNHAVSVPTLPHPKFHPSDGGMYHPLPFGLSDPGISTKLAMQPEHEGGDHLEPKGIKAGPKRVGRSRKRQAPYRVDKDHEGADLENFKSQQAFLSETPGYENVGHDKKVPKCTTKRKKKKAHQSSTAGRPVAGPSASADRHLVTASAVQQEPPIPRLETPTAMPPNPKRTITTIIRSHARSKNPGITFVPQGQEWA